MIYVFIDETIVDPDDQGSLRVGCVAGLQHHFKASTEALRKVLSGPRHRGFPALHAALARLDCHVVVANAPSLEFPVLPGTRVPLVGRESAATADVFWGFLVSMAASAAVRELQNRSFSFSRIVIQHDSKSLTKRLERLLTHCIETVSADWARRHALERIPAAGNRVNMQIRTVAKPKGHDYSDAGIHQLGTQTADWICRLPDYAPEWFAQDWVTKENLSDAMNAMLRATLPSDYPRKDPGRSL